MSMDGLIFLAVLVGVLLIALQLVGNNYYYMKRLFGHFDANVIYEMKQRQDIKGLTRALQKSNVRQAAAEALGELKDTRAVVPLVTALEDVDKGVRNAAALSLDKLGWRPEDDKTQIRYWVVKQDWRKCIDAGAPYELLFKTLIVTLEAEKQNERKAAAQALTELYQRDDLSAKAKRTILSQRNKIIESHADYDDPCGNYSHTDSGIGVDFPL